ncbi:MAG: efflux RND transporter periplasmic adaptor subunit, partial [Leptothrix sp. (in: b-proteobacteria)]
MSRRRPIAAVHPHRWRLLQGVLAASTPWLLLMAAPMPASAAAALQATEVRASADTAAAAFDGVVEAVRQTSVATQVPGAIVQILVKAGDRVSTGQVLVRVDAQTASQNAAATDAQVLSARAALDVAAKDFERQKQLAAAHFISPAALERADAVFRASQAQLDAQLAQAGAARSQIGLHTVRAPFAGVVSEVPV